jgi:thermitase
MIVPGQLVVRLRFSDAVFSVRVPRGRRRGLGERSAKAHWLEFDRLLDAIRTVDISRVHEAIPLWQLQHPRWSRTKRRLESTFLIRFDAERIDPSRACDIAREWKRVLSAEPNRFVAVHTVPSSGPGSDGSSSWAEKINLPSAWTSTRGDPRVTVAVVDSGIASGHEALDHCVRLEPGCDVVDVAGVALPIGREWIGDIESPDDDPTDDVGHGTHMSGLIAGEGFGVAPDCSVLPIRALAGIQLESGDLMAMGKQDDLARAIRFAVDKQAAIVNCSYANGAVGVFGPSQIEQDAIEDATAAGCFVIAAMGNDGNLDQPAFPAAFEDVCGVAAIDSDDARWLENQDVGSQRGSHCDLSAPGVRIESTARLGGSEFRSGTSAATAIVSGAAALVQSFAIERRGAMLPSTELGRLLTASARRLWPGSAQRHQDFGHGCVDPAAAMASLVET